VADAADTLGDDAGFDRGAADPLVLPEVPALAAAVNHVSRTTVRIAFRGELDIGSACQAEMVLTAPRSVGCSQIEVDLSGLDFCDGAGLRVFVDAQHECAKEGGLVLLLDPTPPVLRALHLAGLDGLLSDWRT